MFLLLIIILLLISFACFWESKKERKGLRATLSITLALMLSILMEVLSGPHTFKLENMQYTMTSEEMGYQKYFDKWKELGLLK